MIKEVDEINCYRELIHSANTIDTTDVQALKEWAESVKDCEELELISIEMKETLHEILIARARS